MRFLHCSDVHVTQQYSGIAPWKLGWRRAIALLELGPGGRAAAYRNARATLARIARDAQAPGVDHLILSGDVTAYAMQMEFLEARAALGPLAGDKRRCTVIPGNHDFYSPDAVLGRWFEEAFGPLLESDLPEYVGPGGDPDSGYPIVRLLQNQQDPAEKVAVVGLCSARVPPVPGLSYGVVGAAQRERLQALLKDPRVKDRAVLAVVHHAPLLQNGEPDHLSHGLTDAEALMKILAGPRCALLHGHVHRRYHHPATDARPHLFGAGSSTQEGHEGYWLIDVTRERIAGSRVTLAVAPAGSGG